MEEVFEELRLDMVKFQISMRGIRNERVLIAMKKIERHRFVPEELIDDAYKNYPVSIGFGQTISQPYIIAYMTDILMPGKNKKVLEIGTGSGYQTSILSECFGRVYTVEIIEELATKAQQIFSELEYTNIHASIADGYNGLPDEAPFDGIIATCSPKKMPPLLIEQLAEGGRLVIPVGEVYDQELVIFEKKNGTLKRYRSIPVRFVPMTKKDGGHY